MILLIPKNTFASKFDTTNYEPNYLRSYYVEVYLKNNGPYAFYEEGGYRGWLGLADASGMSVGGVWLVKYSGRLYHPSVKDIPAPAMKNKEISVSLLSNTRHMPMSTKFITQKRTYHCRWSDYPVHCNIPHSIFYDDGY
ncbi:MAG: hypothetical protein Q4B36_05005 [Tissierellia bacterium]|nr:hypothetical protein [Tissierellia bacterium]